jgi:hypothetical protein
MLHFLFLRHPLVRLSFGGYILLTSEVRLFPRDNACDKNAHVRASSHVKTIETHVYGEPRHSPHTNSQHLLSRNSNSGSTTRITNSVIDDRSYPRSPFFKTQIFTSAPSLDCMDRIPYTRKSSWSLPRSKSLPKNIP